MSTLHEEIEKTVNWLAQVDVEQNGKVSKNVREIARIQRVSLHIPLTRVQKAIHATIGLKVILKENGQAIYNRIGVRSQLRLLRLLKSFEPDYQPTVDEAIEECGLEYIDYV